MILCKIRSNKKDLHRLYCLSSRLYLTCADNTVTGVSVIAFTPVAHRPRRGTHVRCNRSTGVVRMTYTGCTGCTVPRIWINIYTRCKFTNSVSRNHDVFFLFQFLLLFYLSPIAAATFWGTAKTKN